MHNFLSHLYSTHFFLLFRAITCHRIHWCHPKNYFTPFFPLSSSDPPKLTVLFLPIEKWEMGKPCQMNEWILKCQSIDMLFPLSPFSFAYWLSLDFFPPKMETKSSLLEARWWWRGRVEWSSIESCFLFALSNFSIGFFAFVSASQLLLMTYFLRFSRKGERGTELPGEFLNAFQAMSHRWFEAKLTSIVYMYLFSLHFWKISSFFHKKYTKNVWKKLPKTIWFTDIYEHASLPRKSFTNMIYAGKLWYLKLEYITYKLWERICDWLHHQLWLATWCCYCCCCCYYR